MASKEEKLARMQEIANRGLQDKLPDDKRAIFDEVVNRGLVTIQPNNTTSLARQPLEQTATQTEEDFIPTEEALAVPAPGLKEFSVKEQVIGGLEALGTLATGATTGAIGGFLGSIEGALADLTGRLTPKEAQEVFTNYASMTTYAPKTEAGQRFVKNIAEKLGVLPPVLGVTSPSALMSSRPTMEGIKRTGQQVNQALKSTASNFGDILLPVGRVKPIAAKGNIKNMRMPKDNGVKRKLLAEQTLANNPDIAAVTKMLQEDGSIVTRPNSVKALKTLSSDFGDDNATATVSVVENMNKGSKKAFNRMLDIIQEGKDKPLSGVRNRPSDVLGDALATRARDIKRLNERSARQIGAIAKNELSKRNIDVTPIKQKFYESMEDLGVKLNVDDSGKVKFDFSESKFVGGDQSLINRLNTFLKDDSINGYDAHKLKQFARELVDFGEGTESAIAAGSQAPIKNLATDINSILVNVNPKYAKANKAFSDTIDIVNGFDRLVKNVDIDGDLAGQSLANKAKRLTSNADSRAAIRELFENAETVMADSGFKVNYTDNIDALSFALTKLEDSFKIAPPNSFQGGIQRAGVNLAQGMDPASAAGAAATEGLMGKVFNLTKPDFDKKMKAYKMLIQEQQ